MFIYRKTLKDLVKNCIKQQIKEERVEYQEEEEEEEGNTGRENNTKVVANNNNNVSPKKKCSLLKMFRWGQRKSSDYYIISITTKDFLFSSLL